MSTVVDDNGKPEVSVALSDFTAFVGFRPPQHIKAFFDAVPEFAGLFSSSQRQAIETAVKDDSKTKEALKSLFDTAIHLDPSKIKETVEKLNQKLESSGAEGTFGTVDDSKALAQIWKKHGKIYGSKDVGLIVTTFLMNLLQLKPGQGCWILAGKSNTLKLEILLCDWSSANPPYPDDIHAYVEGDVIECMANSDNMVSLFWDVRVLDRKC